MTRESDIQRLTELIAEVLRGNRPLTERRIASAIQRHARITTDAHSVRRVLERQPHRFIQVKDRFLFLRRSARWQLVEAGPPEDPGNSGALVPTRPHRPLLSGSAAAPLTFREEEPPPQAIGRPI